MILRFKIKHLMYLVFWTALILAVREPLVASVPRLVSLIVVLSGVTVIGIFAGLYGVALFMEESRSKDRLVDRMCYVLIGAGILFFIFLLGETYL
jgi:hypothetical protein